MNKKRHIWVKKLAGDWVCNFCDVPFSEDIAEETCPEYPEYEPLKQIRKAIEKVEEYGASPYWQGYVRGLQWALKIMGG